MAIVMTEMQKSALLEAGNIGSGHAAIALSQLMGKKIMIAIPSIELFELPCLGGAILDKEEDSFIQVSLKVLGEVKGAMAFVINEEKAKLLCALVMGQKKGAITALGELEQSALKEISSILAASYLNAVSEMINLSLIVSIPDYHIGGIKLLDKILKENGMEVNSATTAICIKTEFIEAATRVEGFLIFIPAENAIQKILGLLGV